MCSLALSQIKKFLKTPNLKIICSVVQKKCFDAKCDGKDSDPSVFARQSQDMSGAPSLVATVLNKPNMKLLGACLETKNS